MKTGILLAVATYAIWGLFPIYFHALAAVSSLRVVAARVVSSFFLLATLTMISGDLRGAVQAIFRIRTLLVYLTAALLIGLNWVVFVWAVRHHVVLEASLGYFINPLLSVLMGVVWFQESLRKGQWFAISLAGSGVLYLTVVNGEPPWIALALALSFALYGLVKKTAPLDPLPGLTLETALLFAPALWYLLKTPSNAATDSTLVDVLLLASGLITALPLWMFANAAQRIPLALLGVLQYITPTLQFFVGFSLYHEPFSRTNLFGFCVIWLALALFATESLFQKRIKRLVLKVR